MNLDELIDKFKSKEPHTILDAVWWVIGCTDKEFLSRLKPFIPEIKKEVKSVDLGGMIYRNSDNFDLAMDYIKDFCSGICHCNIYIKTQKFSPQNEARKNFVVILSSKTEKELYEEHFDVECSLCHKHFKVREVHGWHVPWYDWTYDN